MSLFVFLQKSMHTSVWIPCNLKLSIGLISIFVLLFNHLKQVKKRQINLIIEKWYFSTCSWFLLISLKVRFSYKKQINSLFCLPTRKWFNRFVMKYGLFSAISCCSSSHPPSTFNKRSLNTELDNVNFKIVGGSNAVPGENTYQVSILSFK